MKRDEPELEERFGVRSLALFGSFARDEAWPATLVLLALAALATLTAQGCSAARVESTFGVGTATDGHMLVRWADGRETSLAPEACLSGDRANFHGVDLVAPPYVLRVVAEPLEGIAAAVIDTGSGARTVFRAASCKLLRGDVQRTGWRVNDLNDVSGHLEADCRLPSGEELHGKASFEHCH
jgi:hypothetical protein